MGSLMTRVHAAGTDRGWGGAGFFSEKSCQSLFTDQVKELDSCSTPQKKVLIIPLDSSAVMKGCCCPLSCWVFHRWGGSAKQQMAPAAPRAVRPPPPQLTMVEPEGPGAAPPRQRWQRFSFIQKRAAAPRSERERAASRLRRKQVPPRRADRPMKEIPGVLGVHRRR